MSPEVGWEVARVLDPCARALKVRVGRRRSSVSRRAIASTRRSRNEDFMGNVGNKADVFTAQLPPRGGDFPLGGVAVY